MSIFISLVIFGVSIYLFFITNNKIKNIKENIIIEDSKKELEALITEFNGAAARNIELLEAKIGELQEVLKKANQKAFQLDERIDRANRPIVIEKIVHRAAEEAPVVVKPPVVLKAKEPEDISRSGQLKKLIRQGKTREELISLGYMENEINLLNFLIHKNSALQEKESV